MTTTRPKESSSAEPALRAQRLDDRGRRLLLRLRVVVARERLDERRARLEVERAHAVAARRGGGRSRPRGRSSRRARARRSRARCRSSASTIVNDSGLGRAQRDARGRVVAAGPDVAGAASCFSSGSIGRPLERRVAEHLAVARRRAAPRTPRRGRGRRARAGSRGRGSPPRRGARAAPRGSRMKYWSSASSLATSTASPCPRRPARPHCWRSDATVPGKPTEIDAVEQADVDPELERVRRARRRAARPRRAAARSRAAARACSRRGRARARRVVAEPVGGEAVDQLGGAAALGEAERAQAARDEVGQQPRRLAERARAQAELLVGQRRVPERDRPLRARRAVVADHRRLDAEQRASRARPGSRSSPRRAGTAARRRRPARAAAAAAARWRRASRRRRGRRAPRRRSRSARFVSTSPQRSWCGSTPTWSMSGFVRIRFAHLRICQRRSAGRVAVVDRGAQLGQPERAERAELVLRQRLGRVEVERALLRLARERVEHGQVEGERLAARGAGRDDDVLAARGRLPRLAPGACRARRSPAPRAPRARAGASSSGSGAEPSLARRLACRGRRAPRPGADRPAGRDAHRRARSATTCG